MKKLEPNLMLENISARKVDFATQTMLTAAVADYANSTLIDSVMRTVQQDDD